MSSNGFDYLAAWTTTAAPDSRVIANVSVARVNADGTVPDSVAVPLDPTALNARGVSISPGRDGYFASWISESGLNAAVLDSFGRVERRVTVPQDTSSAVARTLTAWNGAVHFTLSGFHGPFTGTLFDDNAELLASDIAVGNARDDGTTHVALTNDGGGFLVLSNKRTSDADEIYGRRITSSGVAGDWFLIRSVATQIRGLSVGWDGAHDVIAWGDSFGVWTLDLDPGTNAAGPSRQLVPDTATVSRVLRLNGRTWITYATVSGNAYAITVGSDGAVTIPLFLGSGDPGDLAWNGSRVFSVRTIQYIGATIETDVAGSFLSPLEAGTPVIVAKSETDQQNGDLAAGDGDDVVAVWDERISLQRQIFAARLGSTLSPREPSDIQISSSGDNTNPAIAFNGTSYLLVWTRTIDRHSQTVARRFATDGTVLDSADLVIGDGINVRGPRVASDGTSWLVVSSRAFGPTCGAGFPGTHLFATRVSAAGVVLDAGVALAPSDDLDQSDVDLAWTGSLYIAVWTDTCAAYHNPTQTSIRSAWISPDLSRIDVADVTGEGSSAQGLSFSSPRIAVSPVHSLVAWQSSAGTAARFIENVPSRLATRRHAIGGASPELSIPGAHLLDVSRNAGGHPLLLTRMTIPTASSYQGVYQTVVDDAGSASTPSLSFVLDPGEQLMGKSTLHGASRWMAESLYPSIFDPAAGARRLWIREFE